ncbi:hypothetical protein AGABI2DRAFT_189489 [Agaricus bisporus var. bisporus H97]|uniref:hypothetical protein n=1 Tax=Agaricus bisporus var. bisporus (strain H97 / ATCC MYA-4626 / FGSC 10389) TaxID=936046 RepID=UPI00029F5FE0|nr:hypothetical protein AGABI2DRAFT_189489 [Agaricus bisporus var. bisporus H97]EKV52008.1 hypothetical protein AGABI2DRAFT_189489 [Agaricus bisporus var. bisporus H97]
MDQHPMQDDSSIPPPTYGFYPTEQDPSSYNMSAYNGHMPYHVVHPNPPQRQQQLVSDLQPAGLHPYPNIPLIPHQFHHANVYSSSPPHGSLPLSNSPPPPSPPEMYDPLSPPISGSDTSADGLYHHSNHSNSSSINSPAPSRANSLVHRTNVRYNPTPSPTSSSGRRRSRSRDSDEEDPMGLAAYNHPAVENLAHTRKEATRRQRIEAEQRRRDELRDGYAKLKDALPVSNQKSSKVSLLERATNHIMLLEKTNQDLKARINALEQEMARLRGINEKISLGSTDLVPSVFEGKTLAVTDASALTPPASAHVKLQLSTPERPSSAVPSEHEQL